MRARAYAGRNRMGCTDLPEKDPETGETAGLLDAATKSHTAPKIFYTNTSYEYWGRAAALIHASPDGSSDAPLPENVRIYFLAGLQHFSAAFPPQKCSRERVQAQVALAGTASPAGNLHGMELARSQHRRFQPTLELSGIVHSSAQNCRRTQENRRPESVNCRTL